MTINPTDFDLFAAIGVDVDSIRVTKRSAARHPGALRRRELNKYTWTFPSGESYADAELRAARAINQVAARGVTLPLFVTHEMIGRMLLRSLLDLDADDALA